MIRNTIIGAALAALAVTTAFAAAPKVTSPATVHLGGKVTVKASGLKPGRYALTLVSDDHPGRNAACVARLAGPVAAPKGSVKLSGQIPKKLTCWENDSVRLGKVSVTPGAFHLIVAVPDGPSGSNAKYSFVRRKLTIKR